MSKATTPEQMHDNLVESLRSQRVEVEMYRTEVAEGAERVAAMLENAAKRVRAAATMPDLTVDGLPVAYYSRVADEVLEAAMPSMWASETRSLRNNARTADLSATRTRMTGMFLDHLDEVLGH